MTLEEIDKQLYQVDTVIQSLSSPSTFSVQMIAPSWWSVMNAMTISAAVLVFGFCVIVLATYLIRAGKNTEAVLKIFGQFLS